MLGITLKQTQVYREIKSEGIKEGEQRGEKRGREQGREQGREVEARSLILRLLNRRVGELPEDVRQQVEILSLSELENLGEALLDFSSMVHLQAWLDQENI